MGASQGGSFNKSSSKNEGQSTFGQDVWAGQSGALADLYSGAGQLFNNSSQQMQNQMGQATQGMQNQMEMAQGEWGNQLQGGPYQGMDLQGNLMSSLKHGTGASRMDVGGQLNDSLQQSLAGPSATQEINNMIMGGEGNNYADAMRNQYVNDANRASDNMLSNLDARASASGMAGGSRHGTATAQGMQDINQNLQRNMAETGYSTFDKDLDRKLQIASLADQGTLARQQMMTGIVNQQDQGNLQRQQMLSSMLGQQVQSQQGALDRSGAMQDMNMSPFAAYMAPWQAAGQYSSALGDPTVLSSGQASDSATSKSKGSSGSASVSL